jgi:predicted lipoprotein with Yx(FWY)xxD motif
MSLLKLNLLLLRKVLVAVVGPIAAAASVYLLATTSALSYSTAIVLSGGAIALNTLREDDNTLEKNAVLCYKSAMALYTIKWIGAFNSFCLLLWTT